MHVIFFYLNIKKTLSCSFYCVKFFWSNPRRVKCTLISLTSKGDYPKESEHWAQNSYMQPNKAEKAHLLARATRTTNKWREDVSAVLIFHQQLAWSKSIFGEWFWFLGFRKGERFLNIESLFLEHKLWILHRQQREGARQRVKAQTTNRRPRLWLSLLMALVLRPLQIGCSGCSLSHFHWKCSIFLISFFEFLNFN